MLELARARKGYVKVKLYYGTQKPRHIRSILLREQLGLEGPYFESIAVLFPQSRAYPLLETYLPAFNLLKTEGLIDTEDALEEFCFLEEDIYTQAYIIE